jgi:4-amino-4-deoxy-L-arabinose transferase-like glycosyltransferase
VEAGANASYGTRDGTQPTRLPILIGILLVVLLAGSLSVAAGTIMGLRNFRDVDYPDSANLLRVGEFVHSGRLYPDFQRPPYLVTVYGPLTYVWLGVPYRLSEAAGVSREVSVRFAIVCAFLACALLTFLINRCIYGLVGAAWLSVAFAVSPLPLAHWTTQVRGDFFALAFSLSSIYLLLRSNGRWHFLGAAAAAGCAVLTKQTFVAAPLAIIVWLAWRRRWKESVLLGSTVLLTVAVVFVGMLWREPLMWKHIAALRSPLFELREAVNIAWTAGLQLQVEPRRVSRRLQSLRGWGPWRDQGGFLRRCGSEQCGW